MPSPVEQIPQTTQDFLVFKELLYQLVVENKYQRVLETGTDVGDSTRIFSTALQHTSGSLVTIDLKPPVGNWHESWPVKNIQFVQGDSRQLRLNQPIDLLFLDDHTGETDAYTHVKAELETLGVWVRKGGKIVVDDSWHQQLGEGTWKAVREFCRAQQLAYTDYPQGHGIMIIEVTHELVRKP